MWWPNAVTIGQTAAVCVRESRCRDRTRYTVWPDALHLASDRSPESSSCDRTRPVTHDRTNHGVRSALRHALPTGCVTGHSGSARDRTLRSATFTRASLPAVWTDRTRRSTLDRVRLEFFRDKHSGLLPPFLASSAMKNRHFISSKMPLYRSNSTVFANVLTSPSVHHHVHVC
jgi:hypothetical protein